MCIAVLASIRVRVDRRTEFCVDLTTADCVLEISIYQRTSAVQIVGPRDSTASSVQSPPFQSPTTAVEAVVDARRSTCRCKRKSERQQHCRRSKSGQSLQCMHEISFVSRSIPTMTLPIGRGLPNLGTLLQGFALVRRGRINKSTNRPSGAPASLGFSNAVGCPHHNARS